jgi:predicted DNA-binding transcriptional regulator AlpA
MKDQLLLDAAQVAEMLSLNKKTFYHLLKTEAMKTFPNPIQFSERLNRGKKEEVEAGVNARTTEQS